MTKEVVAFANLEKRTTNTSRRDCAANRYAVPNTTTAPRTGNYSPVSVQTLTTAEKGVMSGFAAGKGRMVRANLPGFVSNYDASKMNTI